MHRFRDVSLFSESGTLQNLPLELERRLVEVLSQPRVVHEALEGSLEMIGRTVTGVIDQINGSGPGHDVHGQTKDQDSGADDNADQIVLEVKPELPNIV